jgi:ABC-type Na+ efflux pump permease subunit
MEHHHHQKQERGLRFGLLVALVVMLAGVSVVILQLSKGNAPTTADVNTSYGTIKVLVDDELGTPLSNASVIITSDNTNERTPIIQKDSDGYYTANVASGTFEVQASLPGYKTATQPLKVNIGDTQTLTFHLTKQ